MFGIGLPELVIILVVALLVVGPSKLPEVARSIGKALGQVRRMADDVKDTLERELDLEEEKKKDESQAPKDAQGASEQNHAGGPASQKGNEEGTEKSEAPHISEQKTS